MSLCVCARASKRVNMGEYVCIHVNGVACLVVHGFLRLSAQHLCDCDCDGHPAMPMIKAAKRGGFKRGVCEFSCPHRVLGGELSEFPLRLLLV